QCFGYAAGRLLGNETTLEEVAPESIIELKAAGLESVWNSVVAELQRLDACRDEWKSFDELRALMQLVAQTFSEFGLWLSIKDGLPQVDIPFTADTIPT